MPWINKPKKKERKKTLRRKERQHYYNLSVWRTLRQTYWGEHPLCEACLDERVENEDGSHGKKITPTENIHHIKFIGDAISEEERMQRLQDINNLCALCIYHHSFLHGHNGYLMTKEGLKTITQLKKEKDNDIPKNN